MTAFYKFALKKIKTIIAKWVFKPISETVNSNAVYVYFYKEIFLLSLSFLYLFSDKKKSKTYIVKKQTLNVQNL